MYFSICVTHTVSRSIACNHLVIYQRFWILKWKFSQIVFRFFLTCSLCLHSVVISFVHVNHFHSSKYMLNVSHVYGNHIEDQWTTATKIKLFFQLRYWCNDFTHHYKCFFKFIFAWSHNFRWLWYWQCRTDSKKSVKKKYWWNLWLQTESNYAMPQLHTHWKCTY